MLAFRLPHHLRPVVDCHPLRTARAVAVQRRSQELERVEAAAHHRADLEHLLSAAAQPLPRHHAMLGDDQQHATFCAVVARRGGDRPHLHGLLGAARQGEAIAGPDEIPHAQTGRLMLRRLSLRHGGRDGSLHSHHPELRRYRLGDLLTPQGLVVQLCAQSLAPGWQVQMKRDHQCQPRRHAERAVRCAGAAGPAVECIDEVLHQ